MTHIRNGEVQNTFTYPLNMFSLDLDELENLNKSYSFFGYNRFSCFSIWDKDYLTNESRSIKEKLLSILEKEGCGNNIDKVFLLTSPRYLNYVFNPMSVYYCFKPDGGLRCCLVEVNNTFGDKHVYIVDNPISKPTDEVIGHFKIDKGFHVSPFYDLKGNYEFKFSDIRENLHVSFDMDNGKTLFNAFLVGKKKLAFTASKLGELVVRYPIRAWMTMPRILFQAAKLYFIKKLPIFQRPEPQDAHTIRVAPIRLNMVQRTAKTFFFNILKDLKDGSVEVALPDGTKHIFGEGGPRHELRILKPDFFSKLFWNGEIGFGESFVDHDWETDDLSRLLIWFGKNAKQIKQPSSAKPMQMINNFLSLFRNNNPKQAQKNIHNHYDLLNEMFFLFLDKAKIYSSGIYEKETDTLEQAQLNKVHRILQKAKIKNDDRVLEIGFGWGGFALEAVRTTGCKLTGITISQEQLRYVKELSDPAAAAINFKYLDYRDMEGQFDKIVSIEMLEAVGEQYLPVFFNKCDSLLKPDGLFLLQTIIIADDQYNHYKKNIDWIEKHIFPGGHLPSLELIKKITSQTNLKILSIERIGPSYAKTLAEWRRRFNNNKEAIKALGFDEAFIRKWNYYFSYCEAGFAIGKIDDVQILFKKG